MFINQRIVILFFRYLWIAVAVAVLLFLLKQAFYTKRTLSYDLDFSSYRDRNIEGWYPEQRSIFVNNRLHILSEPLYMKVYSPINFEKLNIRGQMDFTSTTVRLAMRQKDGYWYWQNIDSQNFDLIFDLDNAQKKQNYLEFILSMPDMHASSSVYLYNNWQLDLKR